MLQEKLKGLGVYKEGSELGAYLGKFERIMREGKVSESDWGERLYPRLPETLCMRVAQARDSDEEYGEIKRILLKATGETAGPAERAEVTGGKRGEWSYKGGNRACG